ncbi:MAG: hypothetical protein ACOC8A_02335 [bacterium]
MQLSLVGTQGQVVASEPPQGESTAGQCPWTSCPQLGEQGKGIVRQHGGYGSKPVNVVAVVNRPASPWRGTLPSFDSVPPHDPLAKRNGGLAKTVRTPPASPRKGLDLDAEGNGLTCDPGGQLRVAQRAGFRGPLLGGGELGGAAHRL